MKTFFKAIWFCQVEVYRTNRLFYFLYYTVVVFRSFNPLLWGLGAKILVDIATNYMTIKIFHPDQLYPFYGLMAVWVVMVLYNNTFFRLYDETLSRGYRLKFKKDLTNKLNTLDIQTFESSKFLDTLTNADRNHEKVLIIFRESAGFVRSIIQTVTASVILFTLNIFIPLIILIITVADIIYRNRFNKKFRDIDKEMTPTKRLAGNYYNLFLSKTSLEEMRLYKLSNFFQEKFITLTESVENKLLKHIRSNLFFFTLLTFLDVIFVDIGTRLFAFFQILSGRLTLGEFTFYLNQIGTLSNAIHDFGQSLNAVYREMLELEYSFELENVKNEMDYSNSNKKIDKDTIDIEFRNIIFSYPGVENRKIFDGFNLKINAGERIALVGINGAGKSTLIKLLLRYYDPQEGEILINGINLKEIDLKSWYTKVGALFQDFMKYEVSVGDNVGYGKISNITDLESIRHSLEKSSADQFVNEYPKSIEQILGRQFDDSIQPSGGQWQKIALARTFFRDAPILILDEPTAAIDAKAESEIFEKVENLSRDKTVIIISHRFSTVRNADRIFVIDEGKIIEQGSHDELINAKGRYAELFELQAKGYK